LEKVHNNFVCYQIRPLQRQFSRRYFLTEAIQREGSSYRGNSAGGTSPQLLTLRGIAWKLSQSWRSAQSRQGWPRLRTATLVGTLWLRLTIGPPLGGAGPTPRGYPRLGGGAGATVQSDSDSSTKASLHWCRMDSRSLTSSTWPSERRGRPGTGTSSLPTSTRLCPHRARTSLTRRSATSTTPYWTTATVRLSAMR
jgi:hypothetical protein